MYIGTTEAANLLGVSPSRIRYLLKQGRIKGAYKIGKIWVIPLFNGIPIITEGSRGPKAKWYRRPVGITRIHVNGQAIGRNKEGTVPEPVISVKSSQGNTSGYQVNINGPSWIIYRPQKPINGGAKVWVETYADVEVIKHPIVDAGFFAEEAVA